MEVLQNGVAAEKSAAAEAAADFPMEDDDLLNFSLDDGNIDAGFLKAPLYSSTIPLLGGDLSRPAPLSGFADEEDLPWLSNKDAFPSVETCFELLPENPAVFSVLNQHSPVSVLENSNSSSCNSANGSSGKAKGSGAVMSGYGVQLQLPAGFPARARTKRPLKPRVGLAEYARHLIWLKRKASLDDVDQAKKRRQFPGRKCQHCQTEQTPQWRAGPTGPKSLCNACGVRYKSGRLVPEYRPANSPTYSAAKHSNSHRKIVEMRRQKQQMVVGAGIMGTEYGVGAVGNGRGGLMMAERGKVNGEQSSWLIY